MLECISHAHSHLYELSLLILPIKLCQLRHYIFHTHTHPHTLHVLHASTLIILLQCPITAAHNLRLYPRGRQGEPALGLPFPRCVRQRKGVSNPGSCRGVARVARAEEGVCVADRGCARAGVETILEPLLCVHMKLSL